MEISQKDFSNLTKVLSNVTKTLKNFDDRLNDIEETVSVELPKAIAETVNTAVEQAVENAPAETPVVEEKTEEVEVCPTCGKPTCDCAPAEAPATEEATADTPAESATAEGIEEFSEKVTETIEDLAGKVSDIAERVNKMFVKVFSEGDEQVGDVTDGEEDVSKVEEALKKNPKDFVTEEEPQITEAPAPTAKVVVEQTVPAAAVAPVVNPEAPNANFSERYNMVKNIFNM